MIGGMFTFARPEHHRSIQVLKDEPLPYKTVSFDIADARRAFLAEGILLTPCSHGRTVTIGSNGKLTPFPSDCRRATRLAARWRGNLRVVVNCEIAGDDTYWMTRVERALGRLSPSGLAGSRFTARFRRIIHLLFALECE